MVYALHASKEKRLSRKPSFESRLIFNPMQPASDPLAKIDIVDVVSSYIELKKVGNNYVARCPFHQDDTPSFYVSPSKGIFKCFGCGVGGDAVKFVSLYENIDYWDALEKLANKYHIPIKRKREKDNRLLLAFQKVADFYHEELKRNPAALDYLKSRGLNSKTINRFYLGFGGNTQKLVQILEKEGLLEVYEKTSNISRVEKGVYRDLFRNRLIIPIKNPAGETIAFGGRTLDGSHPKYVNSPESELFKKRLALFGLSDAKDYIKESGQVVIVEGYFDLISLWQEGIRNCVAPLGTALTPDHARLLARYTKKAVLLYDGDSAGRRAVRSSVPHLLKAGLEVRIAYLPDGEDPDSLVKKEPDKLRELLKSAQEVRPYLLKKVQDGDREAFEDLLYFCSYIPDGVERYHILKELSRLTGLPITNLQERLVVVDRESQRESVRLSFHEAAFLAGLYRFGLEGVNLSELNLSPHVLELVDALKAGEDHLLPEYVRNFKVYDLQRAFQESLKALALPTIEPEDFGLRRQRSIERPRKLRSGK